MPPIDARPSDSITAVLRQELTMDGARKRTVARITVSTVIVAALAMTFQIPLPAYMVYLVFLVSREDVVSTLTFSVGGLIAASLAVATSIGLYLIDASEPALRIPLLAISSFAGAFLSRTSAWGPVAFLSGYVLVLSQTQIDDTSSTEALTHSLLWLWLVLTLPIGVTALVDVLFGQSPVALARQRMLVCFESMARSMEDPASGHLDEARGMLLNLMPLTNKAFQWDSKQRAFVREDKRLIALLLEIIQVTWRLPTETPGEHRRAMAATLRQCRDLFMKRRDMASASDQGDTVPAFPDSNDPSVNALYSTLRELVSTAAGHSAAATSDSESPRARFLIPDAFRDRSHARHAIKVSLAVLCAYATYTLLDWPGIRTAVTTCFFVSLATMGESMHKFSLRIMGAITGGLLAGLCIVFVMPMLTDIGQLCLVVAAVSVLSAWISTSSELIAYAGVQIAFAFFLGVLQGYTPASDLTVLRDRVVGILVGNLWITLFFSILWPVSALKQAQRIWNRCLRDLAGLVTQIDANVAMDEKLKVIQDLSKATALHVRSRFEWKSFKRSPDDAAASPTADDVERIAGAVFVLSRLKQHDHEPATDRLSDELASEQLNALSTHTPIPMPPRVHDAPSSILDRARYQLQQDIEHASRTV